MSHRIGIPVLPWEICPPRTHFPGELIFLRHVASYARKLIYRFLCIHLSSPTPLAGHHATCQAEPL